MGLKTALSKFCQVEKHNFVLGIGGVMETTRDVSLVVS